MVCAKIDFDALIEKSSPASSMKGNPVPLTADDMRDILAAGAVDRSMKRWQADLTLGIVALIWGSTFVTVQNALDAVGPLTFVAWRFMMASALLIALFHRRLRAMTRQEALSGGLMGVWLAGGYIFQTIGLQSTTTAKTGFHHRAERGDRPGAGDHAATPPAGPLAGGGDRRGDGRVGGAVAQPGFERRDG